MYFKPHFDRLQPQMALTDLYLKNLFRDFNNFAQITEFEPRCAKPLKYSKETQAKVDET